MLYTDHLIVVLNFYYLFFITKCSWCLNFLFAVYYYLFREANSFVRDIHFYYLYYTIKCSRRLIFCSENIIICSSCLIFFIENNHLFVLLKYLFPVAENNYFILKNYFWKISCKYSQVWSCFEDLIIRKMMVQSKFNLNAWFKSYRFF